MRAPERIWLQDGGDYGQARSTGEVTWCAAAVDETDTGYVRADLHEQLVQILREALVELQSEAVARILFKATLQRRDDTLMPRLETVDRDTCEEVTPLLDLMRRAKALVGSVPGAPAWFHDLLDGAATLGSEARMPSMNSPDDTDEALFIIAPVGDPTDAEARAAALALTATRLWQDTADSADCDGPHHDLFTAGIRIAYESLKLSEEQLVEAFLAAVQRGADVQTEADSNASPTLPNARQSRH